MTSIDAGVTRGDAGLPGYCAAVTVGADGEEHLALLRYNAGRPSTGPRTGASSHRTNSLACPSTGKTDRHDRHHSIALGRWTGSRTSRAFTGREEVDRAPSRPRSSSVPSADDGEPGDVGLRRLPRDLANPDRETGPSEVRPSGGCNDETGEAMTTDTWAASPSPGQDRARLAYRLSAWLNRKSANDRPTADHPNRDHGPDSRRRVAHDGPVLPRPDRAPAP